MKPENTIVSGLERDPATRVFSIWTTETTPNLVALQPSSVTWRPPTLAILRGTVMGAADFTFFYPYEADRFTVRDWVRTLVPRDQWRSLRMEDQFDALLYLGEPWTITISRISPALCLNDDYLRMRLARIALMPGSQAQIDQLKEYCGR